MAWPLDEEKTDDPSAIEQMLFLVKMLLLGLLFLALLAVMFFVFTLILFSGFRGPG